MPYAHQLTDTTPMPIMGLNPPPAPAFTLNRDAAVRAIARSWELDPAHPDAWWIGGFGSSLSDSIELLATMVFSPERGLVSGPRLDILVLPVVPNSPAHPLMVGLRDGSGPIVAHGIEDLAESVPDPFGNGPDHVIDVLEHILDVASSLVPQIEQLRPEPAAQRLQMVPDGVRNP